MIASIVILVLVTVQRLGELVLARRNTTRLLANGGLETGAGHYPLIVGLHAAWLIGLFVLAWDQPVNWIWMGVFVLLQLARIWVIASLGGRWTTRIITVPGETLVRRGPYRFLSHPNYVVVALEIGVLPLAFDLVAYAVVFSILNAAVLTIRIRAESRALAGTGTPEV
ncbi:isoprenylcysteine carboxyl methyltransferase family protein [Brevundimonas sp. DC300-4]|uniref:isoprenylcysteine carboxyl methyltransferase family protein n=1 Tax=Brevundimonas sp. DC300-4 TaxID=2804594 RepID=UPI003CF40A5B